MKGRYTLLITGAKNPTFKSRAELLKFADANKWTKFDVIYEIINFRKSQLFEYSKVDGKWSRRFIG